MVFQSVYRKYIINMFPKTLYLLNKKVKHNRIEIIVNNEKKITKKKKYYNKYYSYTRYELLRSYSEREPNDVL